MKLSPINKSSVLSLAVSIIILGISGCNLSPDGGDDKKGPYISLEYTEKTVSSQEQSFSMKVTGSGDWSVKHEGSGNWCTISRSSVNSAAIHILANDGYDSRSATFRFECDNMRAYLTITQKQKDAIVISQDEYTMNCEGGAISITVNANVEVRAESKENWISIADVKSMQKSVITFFVSANNDSQERIGKIDIIGGEVRETITIHQKGENALVISQSAYYVDCGMNIITIELRSIDGVQCIPHEDWISVVSDFTKSPVTDMKIQLMVDENTTYDSRVGHVTFRAGESEETVIITQDQADGLEVKELWEIGSEDQDFQIDYQSNVSVYAEVETSAQSWLSVTQTKGMATGSIILHALNNDVIDTRVARVRLIGGSIEKDIEVKQDGANSVIYYTSYNNDIVLPTNENAFGANIISNKMRANGIGEITFDGSVKSIGYNAFYDCTKLTSITIPDGVTFIGFESFYGCSRLTSITIPESVTSIDQLTFSGCSSLKSITIPGSEIVIGASAFYGCSSLTSVAFNGNATIGAFAFSGCSNLTTISNPDREISIDQGSFYGCSSLTSITIPDNATSIAPEAFHGCSGLTKITIPDGVTTIGDGAFFGCSGLTKITIPESVTSIGNSAFGGCSILKSITIPGRVGAIGARAFNNCSSLLSITIPESVTSIGDYAFEGCESLLSIDINDGVTSIKSSTFLGCSSLLSITIPESVTSIGNSAFERCSSLTSIAIPESVTSIGTEAFYSCSSLTSITIPKGMTSIGDSAFYGCYNLKTVYCKPTTVPTGGLGMFNYTTSFKIYVPTGSVKAYQSAPNWSNYSKTIVGYDF